MTASIAPAASIEEVIALYEELGEQHYDEDLSQLAHALQTAALARADDAADELVAAALLHDVGHLLHVRHGITGDGDLHHEALGARYLTPLLGSAVAAPIALHVRAKRYLCGVDATYEAELSAGSRASLVRQGGPLDRQQADAFADMAGADDAMRLRRWDDLGKIDGLEVAPLDDYAELLYALGGR